MTDQLANAAEVRRAAYAAYERYSPGILDENAMNEALAAAFAQAAAILAAWARDV